MLLIKSEGKLKPQTKGEKMSNILIIRHGDQIGFTIQNNKHKARWNPLGKKQRRTGIGLS